MKIIFIFLFIQFINFFIFSLLLIILDKNRSDDEENVARNEEYDEENVARNEEYDEEIKDDDEEEPIYYDREQLLQQYKVDKKTFINKITLFYGNYKIYLYIIRFWRDIKNFTQNIKINFT